MRRHTAMGEYGFIMGTLAAFLTAFYSWRLIIMTFHGTPRADRHTMEHVHESTPWMTVPLMMLAVGAVFAGWALHDWFIGDDAGRVLGRLHPFRPNNHILVDIEHVPLFISLLPTVTGLLGIALGLPHVHAGARPARTAGDDVPAGLPVPAAQMVFRRAV